jgi:two-component system chemotaxis response regulator CheB
MRAPMTDDRTLAGRIAAVVIGASAGGVEALMRVLPALPAGLSAPIFVVLHLPRERPSLLAQLFGARCALRVVEAEDKMPVENGTIYFAPPDYHLLVDRGPILSLSADEPLNYSRPAIDILFESATDVYGSRLAAVVLTGANEDGAAGLVAVQGAGGIAIVQDPGTALVPAMPAAALKRTAADYVLPLEDITTLLRTIDSSAPTKVNA